MSLQFLYGFHAITSLLKKNPKVISTLYCRKERHDERLSSLIALSEAHHIPIQRVTEHALTQYAKSPAHQGIVAVFRAPTVGKEEDLWALIEQYKTKAFLLVLEGIEDPQNLGACLRSASAFGVSAVILPKHRRAPLTPLVHKAASGATHHLPIIEVVNLARVLRRLKDEEITLIGTSSQAPQTLTEVSCELPLALLLGGEGQGLRGLTQRLCDIMVRIPLWGEIESLNVSVATGICLYEVRRRGRIKNKDST
ncbi:MAG: 23S rRNA (guanosine(2251)-2'-O)-methyltransferase RlmB [Gammaproteobacteria bacterium]|nr:23S rRNA (guanosine(2251)-2'-O)-methyltransferase RlmB [Gammaproteobacteria bacterium]